MISRVRRSMDKRDQGFTLIELLVVIIIIGILSAIAIPVFLNQRKKAVDASIKSDLRTVAEELETYYTDNLAYATVTGAATGTATINGATAVTVRVTVGNTITGTLPTAETYCLVGSAPSGKATQSWVYKSDQGGLQPKGTTTC